MMIQVASNVIAKLACTLSIIGNIIVSFILYSYGYFADNDVQYTYLNKNEATTYEIIIR